MTVLVLDFGSSSTRALCFDENGDTVPGTLARETFEFDAGPDGSSEDDPTAALARAERVLAQSLAAADGQGRSPSAIAMTSYAASLVCLDARGEPISPVFTYADTRSAEDASILRQEYDELSTLQRTGCRVRANSHPAKLAWLRRAMPDTVARARWFVSLSDFIRMKLARAAEPETSLSLASWTGLLNRHSLSWDADWIGELGIESAQLPRLSGDAIELVLAGGRARPCLPALGDGAAANIGAGCTGESRIAVTVGTTGAMRIATVAPPADLPASLWCYRVDAKRALVGGATTEGGNVVAWLQRALRVPDLAEIEGQLQSAEPDAHGLTILPLFAGERSPGFADAASATIHGLRLSTTAADVFQAGLESIAYRLAMICDHVRGLCSGTPELISSGGALAGSPAWRQMIADAAGLPLRVCEEPEATARGAAILALEQLGLVADAGALVPRLSRPSLPDTRRTAAYRSAMLRQQALYDALVTNR